MSTPISNGPALTQRYDATASHATSLDGLLHHLLNDGDVAQLLISREIHAANNKATGALQRVSNLRKARAHLALRKEVMAAMEAHIQSVGSESGVMTKEEFFKTFPQFYNNNTALFERNPQLNAAAKHFTGLIEKHGGKVEGEAYAASHEFGNRFMTFFLRQERFEIDPKTNEVSYITVGDHWRVNNRQSDLLSAKHFKNQSDGITAEQDKLDNLIQLTTMRMQQTIQEKQRLITMASNLASIDHQGQKAIVDNIR